MKKGYWYAILAVLLLLLCIGIYLCALGHRYKSVSGIAVMDTWTQTLLVPDSTGHYVPFPNPYLNQPKP